MPQIGSKGAELDLLVKQGSTFGPVRGTLKNPDGTPMNLTGASIRGQVRKTPNSALIVAAQPTFTIIDATAGEFELEFSSEATENLPADDCGEFSPSSTYVWDVELIDTNDRVIPLIYGNVNVFRQVTAQEE